MGIGGKRKFDRALVGAGKCQRKAPLLAKNARNGAPGTEDEPGDSPHFILLNTFPSRECFAQRRLPTRAELFGDFGIRHEEIKSMKGTTHDQ